MLYAKRVFSREESVPRDTIVQMIDSSFLFVVPTLSTNTELIKGHFSFYDKNKPTQSSPLLAVSSQC